MKTTEMIEKLYKKIKADQGEAHARRAISAMISNIIADCQEAGDDNIGIAIEEEVQKDFKIFIENSKAA